MTKKPDNMVERVARAISNDTDADWEAMPKIHKLVFMGHARAAIKAMQEPTEGAEIKMPEITEAQRVCDAAAQSALEDESLICLPKDFPNQLAPFTEFNVEKIEYSHGRVRLETRELYDAVIRQYERVKSQQGGE